MQRGKNMKLAMVVASMLALSWTSASEAAWQLQLTPTQVGSAEASGEYIWFSVSGAVSNPAGCSNTDLFVVRSLPKNALAILLTAHVSGKRIRAHVSDTSCDTPTGRPLVTEVAIQD
jgi:hypothetical protein